MKRWYFQVHRWLALVFVAPLAMLVATGLILSFEPVAQRATIKPGSISAETVLGLLQTHDPQGQARGLAYRPYDNSLTLTGAMGRLTVGLDAPLSATPIPESRLSEPFGASRRLHEHLTVLHLDLTVLSTCAMVAIIALGTLLGWPRLTNTLVGWHKGVAWGLLPLLALSPLTGLCLAWGVTLNVASSPQTRTAPLPLAQAVRVIAEQHDLSDLIWLRERGGQQLARLWDGPEARVFVVTRDGLQPAARNLPRLVHEGNYGGAWSGLVNVLISAAFVTSLATGLWLFGRRERRTYARRRRRVRSLA
jgi:uncharacterized iron-regulated membrane protein